MHQQAFLVGLLPLVAAHGFLASPEPRRPGDAYRATCGDQPFYQQSSDINGNVQGIQQVVGSDATADCNLWLCKGFVYEDNTDKVSSFTLGQTIDIVATIAAPHTGYANVSVVKTSTNTMIGTPLIEFQNYASNAGMDANNTRFSVTMPDSLGGDCTTAGDCVLQWFWDAPDIDQTYESCVDFTVSGAGSPGGDDSSSSAPAPATSVAQPTTTAAAATSTAVDTAPATTTTAVPVPDDEEECPADDGEEDEDEEDDEEIGDDDDECPAEDEDDEEIGDDEDECPADDGEDECPAEDGNDEEEEGEEEEAAATTTLGANDLPGPAPTSTVTMVVTSTVVSERLVTVTAEPTACN